MGRSDDRFVTPTGLQLARCEADRLRHHGARRMVIAPWLLRPWDTVDRVRGYAHGKPASR